ncbi:hypothetical protein M5K25_001156 [Dendrobium thyrsiflorum]|uniref:Uncharacterized protein n=1 Tax=Dendrobium thyrsiflorum TaxID=117978 RepID=A0ABD0WCW9_DENTH
MGKDEWQTAISKKTMKMIKQLEGVPGIKWKSSTEPVIELQENPNSGASTSRSSTWRRSKTKQFYKSFSKKPNNPNKRSKLKEKRIVLEKIINNLEDYRQPMRQPITLADFMFELQIDPSEVEDDEQEDEELLHVETCRVISVASTVCQRDSVKDHDRSHIIISPTKMTDKMTSESCLIVVQTEDNSEEELCFPSDDESDQQIASQMEHTHTEKEILEAYLCSRSALANWTCRLTPASIFSGQSKTTRRRRPAPMSPTDRSRRTPEHRRSLIDARCLRALDLDKPAAGSTSRHRPANCGTLPIDSDQPDLPPLLLCPSRHLLGLRRTAGRPPSPKPPTILAGLPPPPTTDSPSATRRPPSPTKPPPCPSPKPSVSASLA